MTLINVRKFCLQRKFKKLTSQRLLNNVDELNSIKKVGVITTADCLHWSNLDAMISEKFGVEECSVLAFHEKEVSDNNPVGFCEKDFNSQGDIVKESVQNFVNQSFDLLICYFDVPNLYLEYLTILTTSNFKVGFTGVNSDLFHLEIKIEAQQTQLFLQETKKYVNLFVKN